MVKCCKLYSLIYDPDGKMWIFGFSPGVCPTELCNLVFSLECLVSNGRRALLGGIRLDGSATIEVEADLLGFFGLGGGARRLQRWDL